MFLQFWRILNKWSILRMAKWWWSIRIILLLKPSLMSMSIAMFMAVVAMLGTVTAYRAALAEQETLRFERRLQQGEMLELVHRQELLSKLSSRTRYENSASLHTPATDSDQEQAGKS